jgi:condensin complex subunit 2
MPRSTRTRQPTAEPLYADDGDSGGDTDVEETPRPTKTNHSKRRFSEINVDKDFSPDSTRKPLRAVNMNDDEAEKRRRRKSAKIAYPDNAEAGPSSDGAAAATDGVAPPSLTRQKTQLASVAQTPIINVPRDVMSSNFEEWMKMATDNVSLTSALSVTVLTFSGRKLMLPTLGTLLLSTIFMTCPSSVTTLTTRLIFNAPPAH